MIEGGNASTAARAIRDCGTVVIKDAVDREIALAWKESLREYIKKNPSVKGQSPFFLLEPMAYHSPRMQDSLPIISRFSSSTGRQRRLPPALIRKILPLFVRNWTVINTAHRRLVSLIIRMNSLWTASPSTEVSLRDPVLYADRCRERHPGDTSFALGPHSDSGTIERWEDECYSTVYRNGIVENWETWDPWNIDGRINANTDMYDSPGGSSVFRTFQGWLALSSTGPGEGTLRELESAI